MQTDGRHPVRLLVFEASLRSGSLNDRLASLAAFVAERNAATVDRAHFTDFDCPTYDSDVEKEEGIPPGAERLRERLTAAEAFIIVSPEYNASMPGGLKNVIDGCIANSTLKQRFERTIQCFMDLVEAATHSPALKKQWVEFLGEQPDAAIDRVETTPAEVA